MNKLRIKNTIKYAIYPLISLLLVLILWYIVALGVGAEFILPTPRQTARAFISLLTDPSHEFYSGLAVTVLHAVVSFLIAFVGALAFAVLAKLYRIFAALFYPIVVIMRVAPTMSVIFLSIIWIASDKAPYLVGVLILFPMLYSSFYSGLMNIDENLVKMADAYGVKTKDKIFGLYLPCVAENVYSDSVSSLSFAVKLAVSGEAISLGGVSIGFLMQASKAYLDTSKLIAYTISAIIAGFLLELIVRAVAFVIKKVYYAKA